MEIEEKLHMVAREKTKELLALKEEEFTTHLWVLLVESYKKGYLDGQVNLGRRETPKDENIN